MTDQPRDEGLEGNEKIEQAVAALQQETTQERLAHTLTVIRRRMREGGQVVVAVEPTPGGPMQLRVLQTADGGAWWYAFTSFDEEMKGADPVQSTFLAGIDRLFEMALQVPEVQGVILNPWDRTLQLDKTLIRIIRGE